ncbi:MAG TPA: SUMF1/EgtB/PvdO family nonheme iron enzyme [Coleofasciculaceae cyanobacterium]|jgi:ergothioneine biosynthesis protein EgtB
MITLQTDQVQQIKSSFVAAFRQTERIFDLIQPDAYTAQPIPLRHPPVFYEGHLPAFLWNTLFRRTLGKKPFLPEFDQLFARGIDPGNPTDAQQGRIDRWPDREEVLVYKRTIHTRFFEYLEELQETSARLGAAHPLLQRGQILFLILEHELMHQETLLYIFHQLPPHQKRPPSDMHTHPIDRAPTPRMVTVDAGQTFLGAREGEFDFGWDNEFPGRWVEVPAFAMDAYPITNGQFLEFVEERGYQRSEFWTPETWQWKTEQRREAPFFWKKSAQSWQLRDFWGEIPLPHTCPVLVTHAEAEAYARFAGKTLPTEAEWHRAAYGEDRRYPWDCQEANETTAAAHGNFDFQHWSPVPVGSYPSGATPEGIHDLLGNAWEWTATPFAPFTGFQPFEGYPQYSADFFDGQHYVMKGGSCFTAARLLRRSFRNWFYWYYPYMYATFRCVQRL